MKRLFTVLLSFSLLAAACSGSSDSGAAVLSVATTTIDQITVTSTAVTSSTAEPVATSSVPPATSSTVGSLARSGGPALEAAISASIDKWMVGRDIPVPGLSLAVRYPDGSEITIARGVSDLVTGSPLTSADYFRIGSISKTITAATVLKMVEDGLIGLDDPVSDYLGDWLPGYVIDGVDYGNQVTVREILGHTDGFKEFAWDPGFFKATSRRLDRAFDPREIIAWGLKQGPQFVPGEGYNYNTVGLVAAGLLIEAVAGRPAEQEIRARIFEPLGLKHIFLPPGEAPPVPIVHGYAVGALRDILDTLPALEPLKARATVGDYFDVMALPQQALDSVGWTGGGMESQAGDLAALFASLFDGTLLSAASITAMTTPNGFAPYGLSLDIGKWKGHVYLSKGGGVPGFRSLVGYLPDSGVSVALLANAIPLDPDLDVLMDEVLTLVAPR